MSTDAGNHDESERLLTVARVRRRAGCVEVMFYETPRIFRVLDDHPAGAAALRVLQAAADEGTPVRVRFTAPRGEVIASVRPAASDR